MIKPVKWPHERDANTISVIQVIRKIIHARWHLSRVNSTSQYKKGICKIHHIWDVLKIWEYLAIWERLGIRNYFVPGKFLESGNIWESGSAWEWGIFVVGLFWEPEHLWIKVFRTWNVSEIWEYLGIWEHLRMRNFRCWPILGISEQLEI